MHLFIKQANRNHIAYPTIFTVDKCFGLSASKWLVRCLKLPSRGPEKAVFVSPLDLLSPMLLALLERDHVDDSALRLPLSTGQTFFPTSCLIAGRQEMTKQLVSSA